jgi:hypothetical protein
MDMDLKQIQENWNDFPEMSMEERPMLSTDLEKMALANPFARYLNLKNKLLVRIIVGGVLWPLAIYQLRLSWKKDESDWYEQLLGFALLTYYIYFHIKLFLYCDFTSLPTLRLEPFLSKIETVLDKYIFSFRIVSTLGAIYLLIVFEKILSFGDPAGYSSFSQNTFSKWLIVTFLTLTLYIAFLHYAILKYKKLLIAVSSYKVKIVLAKLQK